MSNKQKVSSRQPKRSSFWRLIVEHEVKISYKNFKTIAFHLTIVLFCISYVTLGALVFYYVERPLEIEFANSLVEKLEQMEQHFTNQSMKLVSNSFSDLIEIEKTLLEQIGEHERQLFSMFAHPVTANYFDSLVYNNGRYMDMWSLESSFLLAASTIIPVGFGLIAPRSSTGRFLLLLYAFFGIPLALVTISDIGRFLCDFVFRLFRKSTKTAVGILITLVVLYPIVMGLILWKFSKMSLIDSYYYCVTSMFTIGFGDILPPLPIPFLILFLSFGVVLMTISVEVLGTTAIHRMHYIGRQVGKARDIAGRFIQLAHMNINTGLGAGMSQLNNLARFGLLMIPGTVDEEPSKAETSNLQIAYEPGIPLRFVDFPEIENE
ncbi:Ion transport 2 domain containing protein [Aphelenchoides besseyi]|nr:Ion transport 2 domain containing protein [Aphelenchoides besseyi]KAI6202340.1 Ion transport 2 domain containing protein [Aphelenchoides besseyi]